MCDLSSTALVAVSTRFDIPFISRRMLASRCYISCIRGLDQTNLKVSTKPTSVVVCAAKGPRPRYARVWKTNKRIGTISKSAKLLDCIKGLSNTKEEVYGALDAFIAWELEFPLITVKKAIKSLEDQKEWKRLIQVTKWMLNKGQGRTMGTYTILLNALAEDGRLEEAEELWNKLFKENLDSMPRNFFTKMISIYYHREMYDKLIEIFADMEELGIRPNVSIVSMVGKVFQNLGMLDKYEKLNRKYPPPKWKYKFVRGKRIKIRTNNVDQHRDRADQGVVDQEEQSLHSSGEQPEISEASSDCDSLELEEVDLVQDSNDLFEDFELTSEDRDGFESEEVDPVLNSNDLLEDANVMRNRSDTQG